MAVVIETTIGDITVDLFTEERPHTCKNFLKLCKIKYYNFCLFHSIQSNFIAQTGDPSGSGTGGESVYGIVYGSDSRYYEAEKLPKIKHEKTGLLSMVNCGNHRLGSQFFITLSDDLQSLEEHCVFAEVAEGRDVLIKLNEAICDNQYRPYQDIRITHTVVLEDPFEDIPGLIIPDASPDISQLPDSNGRIGADERINDEEGLTAVELEELKAEREAKARATILEIVGDLPYADVAPPENVLFVCKLNPVTTDDDLEIIFSRFGKVKICEVIRDHVTGDSLQYAFIEFEDQRSCEQAFLKMDNVLIDDRRIHVDFSQSVSKIRWRGKGRGVEYLDKPDKREEIKSPQKQNRRDDRQDRDRNRDRDRPDRRRDDDRRRRERESDDPRRRDRKRDDTRRRDEEYRDRDEDGRRRRERDDRRREERRYSSRKDEKKREEERRRDSDRRRNGEDRRERERRSENSVKEERHSERSERRHNDRYDHKESRPSSESSYKEKADSVKSEKTVKPPLPPESEVAPELPSEKQEQPFLSAPAPVPNNIISSNNHGNSNNNINSNDISHSEDTADTSEVSLNKPEVKQKNNSVTKKKKRARSESSSSVSSSSSYGSSSSSSVNERKKKKHSLTVAKKYYKKGKLVKVVKTKKGKSSESSGSESLSEESSESDTRKRKNRHYKKKVVKVITKRKHSSEDSDSDSSSSSESDSYKHRKRRRKGNKSVKKKKKNKRSKKKKYHSSDSSDSG